MSMDCPVEGQLQCPPVERPSLEAALEILVVNVDWIIVRLRSGWLRPAVSVVVIAAGRWKTHIAACLDDILANLQQVGLVFLCVLIGSYGKFALFGVVVEWWAIVLARQASIPLWWFFWVASVRWNSVVVAGLGLVVALVPGAGSSQLVGCDMSGGPGVGFLCAFNTSSRGFEMHVPC